MVFCEMPAAAASRLKVSSQASKPPGGSHAAANARHCGREPQKQRQHGSAGIHMFIQTRARLRQATTSVFAAAIARQTFSGVAGMCT